MATTLTRLMMLLLLATGLPQDAKADLIVTGTVTPAHNVPIVQPPISRTAGLLKIKLEVPANSILLCLGSFSDIFSTPPRCGKHMGDPVGPGGRAGPQAIFLLNATELSNRYLYIFSYPNTPATTFTLTIE
jgi:hypothetical protein